VIAARPKSGDFGYRTAKLPFVTTGHEA